MKNHYSFLHDELAVIEIRKHQWIESQKRDHPIGFATAAVDWIKNYGSDWLHHRMSPRNTEDSFKEKRLYRRFRYNFPVEIFSKDISFASHTEDVNLIGFSVNSPMYLPLHNRARSIIKFEDRMSRKTKEFHFMAQVKQVTRFSIRPSRTYYRIFFAFDEKIRNYLRTKGHSVLALS